jgi:hypothetical protein
MVAVLPPFCSLARRLSMLRYLVSLVLFATLLIAGKQTLQYTSKEQAARAEAEKLPPPINVAEAWQRYHEDARRGIACEGDLPPHPGVVAAVLLIVSLQLMAKPLRIMAA